MSLRQALSRRAQCTCDLPETQQHSQQRLVSNAVGTVQHQSLQVPLSRSNTCARQSGVLPRAGARALTACPPFGS